MCGEVAEWLRRQTANPMSYARLGSNPILVKTFINYNSYFRGLIDIM